jgi:hypothetical protein
MRRHVNLLCSQKLVAKRREEHMDFIEDTEDAEYLDYGEEEWATEVTHVNPPPFTCPPTVMTPPASQTRARASAATTHARAQTATPTHLFAAAR